jgi:hypothetical protein
MHGANMKIWQHCLLCLAVRHTTVVLDRRGHKNSSMQLVQYIMCHRAITIHCFLYSCTSVLFQFIKHRWGQWMMLCVQNSFSESVTGHERGCLRKISYLRTVKIAVYTRDFYGLQFSLMLNRIPEQSMGTFLSVSYSWYQHPLRKISRVCFYVVIAYHVMIFFWPNRYANHYSEDNKLLNLL